MTPPAANLKATPLNSVHRRMKAKMVDFGGWDMWYLAGRFSDWPLGATLLFLSVPAFVVNGSSFEADVPFLAFWMATFALFVSGRLVLAAIALALAAMTAYQAILATPILMTYCWLHQRRNKAVWTVTLTPLFVIAAYQAYERATSGALPATVLVGYFSTYGLQQISNKLRNAAALTAHTACHSTFRLTTGSF